MEILTDGQTGLYQPEPLEDCVPRLTGSGAAGLQVETTLSRQEHLELVRAGKLGSLHSWELVTAVDGPGTRLTYFLSGCPLQCLYCHNPDTMQMRRGEAVLAETLLERIRRYVPIFRASKGGLTISGGEPLLQPAFVSRLLTGAKELGVHTAVDTSGFLGANVSQSMLADIDLVLLDVKSGLPELYRQVTGRALAPTLAFGDRLAQADKPVWVRFVVVPGLTDGAENVAAVADIVAQWHNVERVEVLAFHQMGRDKWDLLGMEYQLRDTPAPDESTMHRVRAEFRARGLQVF